MIAFKENEVKTGTIKNIYHTFGSGIVQIQLQDGPLLAADAGPFFRAIDNAFGDATAALGQEIEYEADGELMQWFRPAE